MGKFQLIECPRDALQGFKNWVPTEKKIAYAQSLLAVGFDLLDVGSFVSPKAVPQMRDTAEVLAALDRSQSSTELLVIVANQRGVEQACSNSQVQWVGYPFSISENFQMRNTHKTIKESLKLLESIQQRCTEAKKQLVVYLSMGFGNPYGDPWSPSIVGEWMIKLRDIGIDVVSLSDTVGMASDNDIDQLFRELIPTFPDLTIGAHLHTQAHDALRKISLAYTAGCRRFDGAIKGFGGCPMAKDELVGNMPTEKLITYLNTNRIPNSINPLHFESAYNQCIKTFI